MAFPMNITRFALNTTSIIRKALPTTQNVAGVFLHKDIFGSKSISGCFCRSFSVVKPRLVSPLRDVPDAIEKPPYLQPGYWLKNSVFASSEPEIKTEKQIEGMRDACSLAREVLDAVKQVIKPGHTTDDIDRFVHLMCVHCNAYPSPLRYKDFPKSVCTSVNNVACHGIPDDRPLEDGDIINVDITVYYKGYHGDTSATFLIGSVDTAGQVLVDIAHECLQAGIRVCGPGQPLSAIGEAISSVAEATSFSIIPDFCGHGIGQLFHAPPDVVHIKNNLPGEMKEGMTFTVEPIISEGTAGVHILEDGWTAVSKDDSRSAQFEHTVLITANGAEVMT